ncbi:MAG: HNH endonuclease, partial [Rubrivivax sp.]|nr:HNH endonuclease [Rubrivivax sp.]
MLVYDGTTRCARHKRVAGTFADRQRGSRHARGYGAAWVKLRQAVLARDGGLCRCAECRRSGRLLPAQEVDHVVPKAQGGSDDIGNLQAISRECHRRKTASDAAAGSGAGRGGHQKSTNPAP